MPFQLRQVSRHHACSHVCLCLFVCLFICLPVCLFMCSHVRLFVCLFICRFQLRQANPNSSQGGLKLEGAHPLMTCSPRVRLAPDGSLGADAQPYCFTYSLTRVLFAAAAGTSSSARRPRARPATPRCGAVSSGRCRCRCRADLTALGRRHSSGAGGNEPMHCRCIGRQRLSGIADAWAANVSGIGSHLSALTRHCGGR
jgi:hypothetical protein